MLLTLCAAAQSIAQPTVIIREYSVGFPFDITAGADGAMWFTNYKSIGRITANGSVTTTHFRIRTSLQFGSPPARTAHSGSPRVPRTQLGESRRTECSPSTYSQTQMAGLGGLLREATVLSGSPSGAAEKLVELPLTASSQNTRCLGMRVPSGLPQVPTGRSGSQRGMKLGAVGMLAELPRLGQSRSTSCLLRSLIGPSGDLPAL
jgi:hypothetical protein